MMASAGAIGIWIGLLAIGGLLASEASMSGTAVVVALTASALLIVLNGFFVAYEFAVVAARRSAFEEDQVGNGRIARAARASLSDLSMQLAGAQLGITMATLALGRVGEPALETIIESLLGESVSPEVSRAIGFATALAMFTVLHLIFGEMVPKNIALTIPEATLRVSVLPYRLYVFIFRPIVSLLNGIANGLSRLFGIEPRDEIMTVHTAAELASIVHYSREGGAIEDDDAELLQGALEFAQRSVSDVTTPIDDHASAILGATAGQLESLVARTGFHRIVILSPDHYDPIGYVHARDLLEIPLDRRGAPVPAGLIRQTALVRGDQSLIQVLRALRRANRQLAVVEISASETSAVSVGVVSVEEVIRALVEPSPDGLNGAAKPPESGDFGPSQESPVDRLDVVGRVLSSES